MHINSRNTKATIGTSVVLVTEQKVLSHNSERIRLILQNNSTGGQVITLAVDADAVNGEGIVLNPGGSMAWEVQGAYGITQGRVTAVSDLAGGTLSIYEEVLQR